MAPKILIASSNKGKIAEYASLMDDMDVQLLASDQIGLKLNVVEDGVSFEENAIKKAAAYVKASGLLVLADDSGLEVDALDGRPGVKTARFGGRNLSPEQRYRHLLELMKSVPWDERTARFVCAIALANPKGILGTAEGICSGLIAYEPAGDRGFGYDPIFFLPERKATLAQLPLLDKQAISHRGRAFGYIKPMLLASIRQNQ